MAIFKATVDSRAEVKASRDDVWKILTDPAALARLTPLLASVTDNGPTWVWRMTTIKAMGVDLTPVFTEKMEFVEGERIVFTHQPTPGGDRERIGVEGLYELADSTNGVHLAISLTVVADLPLPRAASPAATRVMKQTMTMMGDRFSKNLLQELKV